jgi:hypothetical protein
VARKLSLPVSPPSPDDASGPTVEKMRARLGGRVPSNAPVGSLPPGALVTLTTAKGSPRVGVLLSDDGRGVDVYLERGIVKRTRTDSVTPFIGEATEEQALVAAHARLFAGLRDGDRVVVEEPEGRSTAGRIREKCRFGALVEVDGGRNLAVGFRRLWPTAKEAAPS